MTAGEGATRSASNEKRSEPREPTRDPARLVLERGVVVDAMIVDRSLRGLRLRLQRGTIVESSLTALDLNLGMIHQVKVIWKADSDIGVQVKSSFDVRTGEGPEAATLRRLWFTTTSARA